MRLRRDYLIVILLHFESISSLSIVLLNRNKSKYIFYSKNHSIIHVFILPCLFSEALRKLGFARKFMATAAKFACHPVNSPMTPKFINLSGSISTQEPKIEFPLWQFKLGSAGQFKRTVGGQSRSIMFIAQAGR